MFLSLLTEAKSNYYLTTRHIHILESFSTREIPFMGLKLMRMCEISWSTTGKNQIFLRSHIPLLL